MSMQILDPNQFELAGPALIEASAGTGKTYTIASLYLRYIVEQPFLDADGNGTALGSENMLVVTFTRAATAELRERIRARLHTAMACFRGQDPGGDSVIAALLQRYQDQRGAVLKRLYAAEKQMDDAAIFTIHGFCHRALQQNAFASGSALSVALIDNQDALILQAAEDFWRKAVYPLRGDDWARVMSALKIKTGRGGVSAAIPDTLVRHLKGLLSRKQLRLEPAPLDLPVETAVAQLLRRQQQAWLQFRQAQQGTLSAVGEALFSVPRIQKKSVEGHLNAIGDWLHSDDGQQLPDKSLEYLLSKVELANEPAALAQFAADYQAYQQAAALQPQLLSEALHFIQQRLAEEKTRLHLQAPDDLMSRLNAALGAADGGEALAATLAQHYPVAMIDEFQDTDPEQYAIFSRIYRARPATAWLMIGDPKQSIYAFRGADIDTYVQAKQQTPAERQFTLQRNYRSARAVVEATNRLFGQNQAAFLDDQIGYQQVEAHDAGGENGKGALWLHGAEQAALTFWRFDEQQRSDAHGAVQCAEQTAQLLNAAVDGQALLGPPGQQRPLQPGDIAVLVRDRGEAESVAEQLRARGVRSVFLTRESVFKQAVSVQLLRVVEAINEPRSRRLITAALATPLCGLSSHEIAALQQDELRWQQHQQQFEHYQQIWFRRGILAAIYQWMADYEVAGKLLAEPLNGERQLADLMHVAELLQIEALKLDGHHSLLRYFAAQLHAPNNERQQHQLRLESDSNLVQIVTIHASKGLEYPVVMLPFALARRVASEAVYTDSGDTVADFFSRPESLQRADKARLAEEVRLLYVALTRASFACYIGLARRQRSESGSAALTHLFNLAEQADEQLQEVVSAFQAQAAGLIACTDYHAGLTLFKGEPTAETPTRREAQQLPHQIDQRWRVTSYSGLSKNKHSPVELADKADDLQNSADAGQAPVALEPESGAFERNGFSFPRGANPGTALHAIFEHQAFADTPAEVLPGIIETQLNRHAIAEAELWVAPVCRWFEQILTTPIALPECAVPMTLNQLGASQALAEMEFFIGAAQPIDERALNRLLERYPVLDPNIAAANHALKFETFTGLVKGFIDLTFEYQGRFYVCDYKSNHLGDSYDAYRAKALQLSMSEHRYDAQLVFYTLALHRHLRTLTPDYHYDTHMGGAVYLFLRGMSPASADTGVYAVKPPYALIEALDQLFSGSHQAGEDTDE